MDEAGESLWSVWSEMTWTVIAGEGDMGAEDAGYEGECLPSDMFSEGMAAPLLECWSDEVLKNTQLFQMGQKPCNPSSSLLYASECPCQIPLSFWLAGRNQA